MPELKQTLGIELSLAGQFSEQLRARTEDAKHAAEVQEIAALDERIARVTNYLMKTLRGCLIEAAGSGAKCYSICYMYVDGYHPDEFRQFHDPFDVAHQFGEAMRAAVKALDADLDVQYDVFSWGRNSAYPEVSIRW